MDSEPTRYVALLRGINVGGNKRVPMAELREVALGLGHGRVATYINSGNLLLDSGQGEAVVAAELSEALRSRFGFAVDVVVRPAHELRQVLAENPYPDGDPKQVTVAFLVAPPAAGAEARMTELASGGERFTLGERHVFVDFAGGLARSRLAAQLGKALGVAATTRNVRTVATLVSMGEG
jgi:uncharacterized protein (DUF1697 family)